MNPKEMIMTNSTNAKAFTIALVTALTLVFVPLAKAEGKRCSNATVKGTFGEKDTGFITAPPEFAGPFAGINTEVFDGNGGLAGAGMVSINGNIVPQTYKGTYMVNPDCTGTYTVLNSLGLTIHAFFVVVAGGNELEIVITDPGTVITCVAHRQSLKGEWEE
jgi:hypothetical protein